jgi:hypothetical protein
MSRSDECEASGVRYDEAAHPESPPGCPRRDNVSVAVDVLVEARIERPRAEVAAFAGDPTNAPQWYVNIKSVRWRTPPPVTVGSRIDFVARFLGRRIAYTYEVAELSPGACLVMRTERGPFPMETTYTWEPVADGTTLMRLRNRGGPKGLVAVAGPLLQPAMRRAMTKDLQRLKVILEHARSE